MKVALLADVHANAEALERVLEDADAWGADVVAVAGDVVGYGADPDACVRVLRARGAFCVAGNHEDMVLGRAGFDRCVHAGIRAALFTREALSPESRAWLAALPSWRALPGGLVVCHGAPDDPSRYVTSTGDAARALAALDALPAGKDARLLGCGHTHRPVLHGARAAFDPPPVDEELRLPPTARALVNPGSVGQARDGQARARYARVDLGAGLVVFRALPYDHEAATKKMRRAGLVPRVVVDVVPTRLERWRTKLARRLARTAWGRALLRVGLP